MGLSLLGMTFFAGDEFSRVELVRIVGGEFVRG